MRAGQARTIPTPEHGLPERDLPEHDLLEHDLDDYYLSALNNRLLHFEIAYTNTVPPQSQSSGGLSEVSELPQGDLLFG